MKSLLVFLLTFTMTSSVFALKPTAKLNVLQAKVTNLNGKPYVGETITFKGTQSTVRGTTDSQGNIEMHIPKSDTYEIQFESITGPYKCGEIYVPDRTGTMTVNVEYENTTVELKDVLFDTGKASLKSSSFKSLNDLVKGMNQYDTLIVEIAGHTDNIGGEEFNMVLSQDRANSVRDYLISKGIKPERVTAVGYAYSQPVADNSSEAGRAQNRRTEVRILNKKD
jgi:outer membrane protein OmpA-like peptidoglycan-associated protein